jgi:NTP pyrophosphohydrolases containing a Zn-finger, probably nucleic-acid-binding
MIPFTGNPLNRRSEMRADSDWVSTQLKTARILPFFEQTVLVTGAPVLAAAAVPLDVADGLAAIDAPAIFLGIDGGPDGETAVFALDVSADPAAPQVLAGYGEFRELRSAAPFLRKKDLAILSQAKGMLEWHARHGFCARCGAKTTVADAGFKRICPACKAEHFPRTDPAVIMLVTHQDKCLLARNVNWAPDFYSTLAGFVEPGESIEEAVARELYEEAGVKAHSMRYFASQPWPFPAALMLGFYAETDSFDLRIDPSELADAVWYSKDEARALLAGELAGRRGPMKAAIAYHLIKGWVEL